MKDDDFEKIVFGFTLNMISHCESLDELIKIVLAAKQSRDDMISACMQKEVRTK